MNQPDSWSVRQSVRHSVTLPRTFTHDRELRGEGSPTLREVKIDARDLASLCRGTGGRVGGTMGLGLVGLRARVRVRIMGHKVRVRVRVRV